MERFIAQTLAAAALSLLAASAASAQSAAPASAVLAQQVEIIRGPLPSILLAPDNRWAAVCPNTFHGAINQGRFICSKVVRQVSDIKCPTPWTRLVSRNVAGQNENAATSGNSDRDICTKPSINITSDGSLSNFQVGVDYVFVPLDGERNGTSFVAADPTVAPADGWRLDVNRVGVVDRYVKLITAYARPQLVRF